VRIRSRLAACLFAATLARTAYAEPTDADRALATELFQQGRALIDAEQYAAACPKLAESQRLLPGGGTLLNLAICHEKQGRLATAWAEFNAALGWARRDGRVDRERLAQDHIAAIEPKLSRLSVVVPAASDALGLEVTRDGSAVGRAAWQTWMPVDPGKHVVEASTPGKRRFRVEVEVGSTGDRQSVTIPVLEAAPAPPPPAEPRPRMDPPLAPESPPAAPVIGSRVPAYVTGSIGLAALAVGGVFGGVALGRHRDSARIAALPASDPACAGSCVQAAKANERTAGRLADAATGTVIAGALAAGAGVALFVLSAPKKRPAAATLAPRVGGVEIAIAW
jgi:hypothetical protein